MTRFVAFLCLVLLISPTLLAQGKPKDGDSTAYVEAYELLMDSRARALKAVDLLIPEGRRLDALNEREPSLLRRAYNELGNRRELLVLKATTILGRRDDIKDAERRVVVADLLVDAYRSGPGLPMSDNDNAFAFPDSPDFIDHLRHGGNQLTFRSEQIVEVNERGEIVRIEHVDLPGQVEALAEFKKLLDERTAEDE